MNIIPELNLNKHPKDVKPYSLVNAQNMMIHQDSALLCSDNKIVVDDFITGRLKESIGTDNYKIRYVLPCNTEFILFVETDNPNRLNLIRYNEKYKYPANLRTEIEYNEGTDIQGTFTYNKGHLIIAIASPGCPLKVLDLGGEDDIPIIPPYKQAVCPEIRIPNINVNYLEGHCYKGWVHVFIRFKINTNNYTQWFNTNKSIFIDSYSKEVIEDYYISAENNPEPSLGSGVKYSRSLIEVNASDSSNIANKTFVCTIDRAIYGYDYYQLGFIIVRKDSTKCFRTNDIENNKNYTFNLNSVIESSLNEMITSYDNYYDVKTIDSYNNSLYIGNYIEKYDDNELRYLLKDITLTFSFNADNNTNLPNQYYNLFVHFIDKHGKITDGFPIHYFNVVGINNNYVNKGDYKIIATNTTPNIKCSINKLPLDYMGYFISYEQLELNTKLVGYTGTGKFDNNYDFTTLKIFTEEPNILDRIDLNFNMCRIIDINNNIIGSINIYDENANSSDNLIELLPADNIDNKGYNTKLIIKVSKVWPSGIKENSTYKVELYNEYISEFYNKHNKILIPCSSINYTINTEISINTNTSFYTTLNYIGFQNVYYNESTLAFRKWFDDNSTYFPTSNSSNPFVLVDFDFYRPLPYESCRIKNAPTKVAFPIKGLNTTNENEKAYALGCIVEPKNIVDLYEQHNVPHYENYPKYLTNYVEDNIYESEFPKTIRRSNVISDESVNIGWRFFEPTNYKNIIENKGSIIKLSSLGHIMLVHTEHSLFQFNCDSALKTNENKQISIANNDIWDLNYQELITSEFGCAGITNPNHAVIGTFGYIFYEEDNDKIYRYDNNSVEIISSNINGYLRNKKLSNLIIIDDIKRNRLMFIYNDANSNNMLSYNYKHNCFVSFHDNIKRKGFNTKLNTYYFSDKQIYKYSADEYNMCACAIMVNEHYPINKMLEYIKYKVNKITDSSNLYLPQDIRDTYYSGDKLRVLTEECDTGLINLYIENPKTTINSVKNYTKPYRELGNWNYNMFRNNPTSKPIRTLVSDLSSRLYGNWYVFNFAFSDITTENKCIEVESLTCAFNKNLT